MAYIKCLRNVITSTIPDGKTVTPTDVVATWLACGSRTEEYTTLSAVLADSICLNALMASDNAVDYLVRSTTFASDITSDSGAMTAIGLNNYASNTLLGNSTWCAAICNSTYFESVLNVKVPVMTSDTTPSGIAYASAEDTIYNVKRYGYLAFDGDTSGSSGIWIYIGALPQNVGYKFTQSFMPKKIVIIDPIGGDSGVDKNFVKSFTVQASNDDFVSDINDLLTETTNDSHTKRTLTYVLNNNDTYNNVRINFTATFMSTSQMAVNELQFYGRADV